QTDERASDMTRAQKQSTTVAMDYGVLQLEEQHKVHLYGTPGQERFDFMWDILSLGGLGLILLINNGAKQPLQDLEFFLEKFQDFIRDTAVVVGVTHTDSHPEPGLAKLRSHYTQLAARYQLPTVVPIFAVDARSKEQVAVLLETLLYSLDTDLVKHNA
ncbi:MAG: ATP/GTP-binding protein, partial [Cellvibrionaceae bacterium]|nr:ATP/GTP-binding protein [Cellvibrionaceae bacterium]